MGSILTPRNTPDAVVGPRIAHNWIFLEKFALPPLEEDLLAGTARVRDFAGGADLVFNVPTPVTYEADGTMGFPAGSQAIPSRPIIELGDNTWQVLTVGVFGGGGEVNVFSDASGGVYVDAGNQVNTGVRAGLSAAVVKPSDTNDIPSTFCGVSIQGKKGGTMTAESALPNASAVVSMGTASMVGFPDIVNAGSGIGVDSSRVMRLAGVMVIFGASITVAQRQSTLIEYTTDLYNGLVRTPATLETLAF